jgi:hypothetical protein
MHKAQTLSQPGFLELKKKTTGFGFGAFLCIGFPAMARDFSGASEQLPEIAKPEAPLDAASFLRQLPVWGLCMKERRLLARKWRDPPATGSTGFAYKRFGHIFFLPLVSTVGCTKAGKP